MWWVSAHRIVMLVVSKGTQGPNSSETRERYTVSELFFFSTDCLNCRFALVTIERSPLSLNVLID